MIAIANSSNTNTDWVFLSPDKKEVLKTHTHSMNPTFFSNKKRYNTIATNGKIMQYATQVKHIYLHTSGVNTSKEKTEAITLLQEIFENSEIVVSSSIMAAALAVSNRKKSITCMIDSGSNTCFYDGKNNIVTQIPSLGYLLMDDASGSYFGKQLLRDYFYKKMPKKLHDMFQKQFNLFADDVYHRLYDQKDTYNYLASFSEFVITHKKEPYCTDMIRIGLSNFIENQITQHTHVYDLPIHFVGEIPCLLQDEIEFALKSFRLNTGKFISNPIDGLVNFYRTKI